MRTPPLGIILLYVCWRRERKREREAADSRCGVALPYFGAEPPLMDAVAVGTTIVEDPSPPPAACFIDEARPEGSCRIDLPVTAVYAGVPMSLRMSL